MSQICKPGRQGSTLREVDLHVQLRSRHHVAGPSVRPLETGERPLVEEKPFLTLWSQGEARTALPATCDEVVPSSVCPPCVCVLSSALIAASSVASPVT